MSDYSDLPQIVQQIGSLNLRGLVIPSQWFYKIKLESGKTDIEAIMILSEIIDWYKPTFKCINEGFGDQQIITAKFKYDYLNNSEIQYINNKFGLSNNKVKKALSRLEESGYIFKPNANSIAPVYEEIYEITF